jgi:hypothetical protein
MSQPGLSGHQALDREADEPRSPVGLEVPKAPGARGLEVVYDAKARDRAAEGL